MSALSPLPSDNNDHSWEAYARDADPSNDSSPLLK